MHVHTKTGLTPKKVHARFEVSGEVGRDKCTSSGKLLYAKDRTPPKFFLAGAPVTPPAAAEVAILEQSGGAEVVLRLMWGPLPAPFPRALAGAGLLLGLLIAIFSDRSIGAWTAAAFFAVLPGLALLYQQRGERELQSQLSRLLDGARFTPKPH
jgi:hypothetical protein